MADLGSYNPGPAHGVEIEKNGDNWTLIITRELRHAPERVWRALTDPAELRQWAPFDSDSNLGLAGATAKLTTVGAPSLHVNETTVIQADEPQLLIYNWGGSDIRWELEPIEGGTRLTLWTSIDRDFISMGAAGWHICLDVMDHLLRQEPIARIVGTDALKFEGWRRLNAEYAAQFGVDSPETWPGSADDL